ncbi:MAG: DUF6138 family protein [Capnocytophaga granulosa]
MHYKDNDIECDANDVFAQISVKIKQESATAYDCSRFLFDFHTDLSKDIISIAFYVIILVVNKSVRQDTCPLFEVHSRFFRA